MQTHQRVYNTLGQLASDLGAYPNEATAYTYDSNNNRTQVTDPLLHKTANSYDALNRLAQVTDPALKNTGFALNLLDQLTAVTDPRALATRYTVDALENVSSTVSPDSGTTTQSQIDDAGNVTQRRDAKGQLTSYQYDALNRLTRITRSDGSLVSFTYDQNDTAHGSGIGRLTTMSDPSGSTNWTYDLYGHVTKKIQGIGAVALTTSYTYDGPTGHLLSLTYPSTKSVTCIWTNGQITALTSSGSALVSTIVYQPFGGPKSWLLANGETDTRTYDLDGRITNDPIETIGYDTASRITALTLGNHSAIVGSQTYGYDELDRVTSYTGTGGPIAYTYDASGNRLTQTVNGTLTTYTVSPGSNRYTATNTGSSHPAFGYDANGSRVNRSTNTYGYDAAGRLASFTSSNKTAAYVYNGTGARVMKTVNGVATLFAYDEAGHLTGDYTATGTATTETVYLGDMPVAVLKGSTKYYVHADYRNAPRQIDDGNRAAVWTWSPLPFGDNVAVANPLSYNLRFPGQYFDSESGLFQNGYRDYDPVAGQYIESDPIGLGGGINTYAYALNRPTMLTDPTGLGPVLALACTVANGAYQIHNFNSTASDLSQNTDLLRDQLNRVNDRISECGPNDGEKKANLLQMRADLTREIVSGIGQSVGAGDSGHVDVAQESWPRTSVQRA